MDLLNGNLSKLYGKYFSAAFGSSCISCIYGIVDLVVIGQYCGPDGSAAISVVMPIFNALYATGLLLGIGGSVLYSTQKGKNLSDTGFRNEYFTCAMQMAIVLGLLFWFVILALEEPLLYLFGANEEILPLALEYLKPIKAAAPLFIFVQLLGCFLRNDDAPGLATAAVMISGVFNVFADVFFVFGLDMGMIGSAYATALGAVISVSIMLTHFVTKSNTLRIVRVRRQTEKIFRIAQAGFAAALGDLSMGILTILFNRRIMYYLGSSALSIFSVLINLSNFVQCCGCSIGQATQPILSMNYGAGKKERIKKLLGYAFATAAVIGFVWTAAVFFAPNAFIRFFMSTTQEILDMAPAIMRAYAPSFLVVPFNVFAVYYLQSLMQGGAALCISLGRGLIVSGLLIMIMPVLFGAGAIWYVLPVTEAVVGVFAAGMLKKYTALL